MEKVKDTLYIMLIIIYEVYSNEYSDCVLFFADEMC